jgi:hypothetical protein
MLIKDDGGYIMIFTRFIDEKDDQLVGRKPMNSIDDTIRIDVA